MLAQGRAKTYLWLSSAFLNEPTPERLNAFLLEEVLETVERMLPASKSEISRLKELRARPNMEETADLVRGEFERLFIIPNKSTYVPPYESCFREKTGNDYGRLWGEATRDIVAIYQAGGFEPKLGHHIIAPDHIGLELAFMSTLCYKETNQITGEEKSPPVNSRTLQKAFLDAHLVQWLPAFSQAIRNKPNISYFAPVSSIVENFVINDGDYTLAEA